MTTKTRIYLFGLSACTSKVYQLSIIVARHLGLIFLVSMLSSLPFDVIPLFRCRSHIPLCFVNFLSLGPKCPEWISLSDKSFGGFISLKVLFLESQMVHNVLERFHILVVHRINSYMFPRVGKGANSSLYLLLINQIISSRFQLAYHV